MSNPILDFYQKQGWQLLQTALNGIAGQPVQVAQDPAMFRAHVIERGWASAPEAVRALNRQQLRWDDLLLALRREVYSAAAGRLVLRPDALAKIFAAVSQVGGGTAPQNAAPPMALPVAPPVAPRVASPVGPAAVPRGAVPVAAAPRPAAAAPARAAAPPVAALGIDLGTTFSVVAHLDVQGRPTSIQNGAGDILTPSVVLFDEDGVVVGKEAALAAPLEPEKVAQVFKRDMGKKAYAKKIRGKELPPEVISSFVLKSLKADAERKLGPVRYAVITVPAYFDEARRQATIDAGRLAGLEVLDIINEPTAAALAYGYQLGFLSAKAPSDRPLRVLIYDLGGGTFDVTIVQIHGTSFKALATDGDVYLGGKDWDMQLIDMAATRFQAKTKKDPRHDVVAFQELWIAAEAAKRTLSERAKASIFINHGGERLKVEVTRQEFDEATTALVGRTQMTSEIVVRQAGLTWKDIDKVLLVGGSTRMPAIGQMIKEMTGKEPERSVSPDEAIAHGAALYADLLIQRRGAAGKASKFSLTNVNSHSLGIVGTDPVTKEKRNQILIPKNTPLPARISKVFKTSMRSQPMITIRIVEGESPRPEACAQIGVCTIKDLPPNLPEGTAVQVTYAYQDNGQLNVMAKLEGHPAIVSTYFLRENNMSDPEAKQWTEFVAKEWGRRSR